MFRHDENAAPTHAQFAMRVAILGGIGIVAFAAIFFRLWFLEVLSGEAYLKEANANRVREIKIQAPRGEILDRAGRVLVENKTVLSLQVRADELPHDKQVRNKELKKLAGVANMSYDKVKQEIRQQTKELPANPVTLQQDVDKDLVYYLRERQDEFPGVTASQVYVREYPNGTLGAQLFGYVSEIGPDQLTFDEPGAVLITEKDAVKCESIAHANVWCVVVDLAFDANTTARLMRLVLRDVEGRET